MHSTSIWPSHSERGSGLRCMRWPLQRLRRLRVVLVPVVLPAAEQRRRPEQCRRVRQQRKAELGASRFVRGVQACRGEGIADKELSALLARDLLVPIVHDTTYEALREVSPLLGSRSGLSTAEGPMADVAAKLAELVAL